MESVADQEEVFFLIELRCFRSAGGANSSRRTQLGDLIFVVIDAVLLASSESLAPGKRSRVRGASLGAQGPLSLT